MEHLAAAAGLSLDETYRTVYRLVRRGRLERDRELFADEVPA
jgi:hypothetical protein